MDPDRCNEVVRKYDPRAVAKLPARRAHSRTVRMLVPSKTAIDSLHDGARPIVAQL